MSNAFILDIEGTITPITFVKTTLFPYFLEKLPSVLDKYVFPVTSSDDVSSALAAFECSTREELYNTITDLVARDIKDARLKQLQGLVWEHGYASGEIQAPMYADAIAAIKNWAATRNTKMYIYSSGSIHAQKLLIRHVIGAGDMSPYISDYFDIPAVGSKVESSSYTKILDKIQCSQATFFSDNINEINAARKAGLTAHCIWREGNAPVEGEPLVYSLE